MQATAMGDDHLCVVAPLFYELLYVLARQDSKIQSIEDLRGHRVAVGPENSGSQATAELVFESIGLDSSDVHRLFLPWEHLLKEASLNPQSADRLDAAMICIGQGSVVVSRLLESGHWRIVPIEHGVSISLRHPTLRPMMIHPMMTQGDGGIPTVGTTAFLAARDDTPAQLILATLNALYADPPLQSDLISRRHAAEWQGLDFHHAARRYYRQPVSSFSPSHENAPRAR